MSGIPRVLRVFLGFATCTATQAFAQDGPGLGIGLALIFIVLPVLMPLLFLGAIVWILWALLRARRKDLAEQNEHQPPPPVGRMGE